MRKFLWSFFEVFETIAIAVVAVFLVRSFIAQPFLVSGASMEPNFYDGNYLLVDELSYRFREPERGEVIVFKYPGNNKSYYIKRIIGLPGEKIVSDSTGLVIYLKNSEKKKISEDYLFPGSKLGPFEVILNENEYFVMGDNRNFSFDSRSWGTLPKDNIVGVTRFRLWPINQVMAFSPPSY